MTRTRVRVLYVLRHRALARTVTWHRTMSSTRRNVAIGVAYGVLLGAVLLGPVGVVAGGFGGRAVVRRRERRWCKRQSSTSTVDPTFRVVTE
jgi:hypothetical protein